jgi:hypothetical protein
MRITHEAIELHPVSNWPPNPAVPNAPPIPPPPNPPTPNPPALPHATAGHPAFGGAQTPHCGLQHLYPSVHSVGPHGE